MTVLVNVITLAVTDMDRAKQFYATGMGCQLHQDHGQFVSFSLGDGSSALALYTRDALAADAGVPAEGSGFRGVTLSHIVASTDGVDEVLAQAEAAGGKIVRPAQDAQWGGYFGYFSDPDGYLWKIVAATSQDG